MRECDKSTGPGPCVYIVKFIFGIPKKIKHESYKSAGPGAFVYPIKLGPTHACEAEGAEGADSEQDFEPDEPEFSPILDHPCFKGDTFLGDMMYAEESPVVEDFLQLNNTGCDFTVWSSVSPPFHAPLGPPAWPGAPLVGPSIASEDATGQVDYKGRVIAVPALCLNLAAMHIDIMHIVELGKIKINKVASSEVDRCSGPWPPLGWGFDPLHPLPPPHSSQPIPPPIQGTCRDAVPTAHTLR
jgi:hypothetical protein